MKAAALAMVLLSLAPSAASACADPVVPSFQDNLAGANHIFVFRLTSLELTDDVTWPSSLRGTVKVVRVLKGTAPMTGHVTLTGGACCGIKLGVGRYYIAALERDLDVLELEPGDQSILDVTDDFTAGEPGLAPNPFGLWPIQLFLLGHALPADYPSDYQLESTLSCPRPPPDPRQAPNNSFKGMPLRGTP